MLNPEPNYQVLSQMRDGPNLHVRQYKKRKTHTKTRSGCLTCRARKVKCDESRPVCIKCKRNARPCSYSATMVHLIQENKLPHTSSISSLSAVTLSTNPMWDHNRNGTSNIHLVQHLLAHWIEIFHISCDTRLISLSKSNHLVESTLLAISACHLRHIAPDVLQHQIAEYFHQSQVLSGLRRLFNIPAMILEQSDADGLILCATLLNMITFALPESRKLANKDPRASWVFELDDDCRGWLDLQIGLRPLLQSTAVYLENTVNFLGPIFFGGEKKNWEFKKMPQAAKVIPQSWVKFFELKEFDSSCDCKSNEMGEIFRGPVAILAQLRDLEPVSSNIYKSIQFLAKIQHEFRALLLERDNKALWLFGYWLGLLCRFDNIWWCKERARRDYTAICMLLQQRHLMERMGVEGQLWTEMMMDLESVTVRKVPNIHQLIL